MRNYSPSHFDVRARQQGAPERGFALAVCLMMLAVLSTLCVAYVSTTQMETLSTKFTKDSVGGFYAAEAGLNLRAEEIRQEFVGYNRPTGVSPGDDSPCRGSNMGAGNFACQSYTIPSRGAPRTVMTYVEESAGNPVILTIPPGERFQGLNAQEYRYIARSFAHRNGEREEAILELRFKSRLVPMFQFAAFYDKDLEILPGPNMTLSGPVHTNGLLFLNSGNTLTINGQVTTALDLYRGRKNQNVSTGTVRVFDPTSTRTIRRPSSGRGDPLTPQSLRPWNDMIQVRVPVLTVPRPEVFDPVPGHIYWDRADLRIVLALDNANNPIGVQVRDASDAVEATKTATLNDSSLCPGQLGGHVVGTSTSFYDNREGGYIRMLEVDMRGLLDCIHSNNLFTTGVGPHNPAGKRLDDDTEGGLVFHFTVKGPSSALQRSRYAVRLRNGETLQSSIAGAPVVQGISVISDQAAYVMGHYNRVNKIPAAVMVDSLNILSSAWSNDNRSTQSLSNRVAANTTVNSAFLAGTDTTGSVEGVGGLNGAYNGGLENYPRLHERWSGRTLTYRGSFVSLGRPRHVDGDWRYGGMVYEAPNRDWNYDIAFNDAAYLPPITPRFVYLRQELFVRDFER